MERGPLMLSNCTCSSASSNATIFFGLNQRLSINLPPQLKMSASYTSSSYRSSSSSSSSSGFKNPMPLKERRIKRELFVSSVGAEPVTLKENESSSLLAGDKVDDTYTLPRFDRNGRFCSPRAARELALLIVYASCLDGMDPVRLFEKRLNAPREPEYVFDKSSLLQYDHMRFGGPPVTTSSVEEAEQLRSQFDAESSIEAEVLSAPLKLVYGKLLLRFTRKLLAATVDKWDEHVLVIDKAAPSNWKAEPAGRILEFSILHLAMSEISVVKTRHQIVINEAVDLAKRFCDGSAPRIINGCLRTFVQE
ncbi:hypothetical protein RND81_09G123500 [Saponaria officinalis]|uniref:NusB/RsmB/TIM44 domain-containing protein n=1 Tax=Saponaria officinalis TaxID=3572 RepID=A0AAW1IM23_SAPOF